MANAKKHDYKITVKYADGDEMSIDQIMSFHKVGSWAHYFLHEEGAESITIEKSNEQTTSENTTLKA